MDMTARELEELSKPELIAIILRLERRLGELEAECHGAPKTSQPGALENQPL
jgi:hypothetical protein